MPKAKPISKLTVTGRNDVQLELAVYAETEWLAVTREMGISMYAVTHKPTGMIVTRATWSLAKAKRALKKIAAADIDWDWGKDWTSRIKHNPALAKRDKKFAAARKTFGRLFAGRIVEL